MSHHCGRLIAALLGGIGSAGSLPAQQVWLGSGSAGEVSVEILRPDLKTDGDQSFTSVAVFMTGRLPINAKSALVAEVPFANGNLTYRFLGTGITESGSTLGNPYVGIESGRDRSPLFAELGFRFPLASDNQVTPVIVGAGADLERIDAFVPHVLTVSAFANYRFVVPGGIVFRLRAGPLAWIATKDSVLADNAELWVGYAVQAGYQSPSFTLLGGIGGRAMLTENVSQRFTDQLVVSAAYRLGGLRPGVSLRLPLDNGRNQAVGSTIGISLSVELR